MKKNYLTAVISLLLVSVLLLSGCGSSSSDTNTSSSNDDNTLVIGVDDQFPPMGYRDESGNIVGFDIDLAQAVADKLGMKLKVQQIDWSAKELELDQGNIDAIWNGLTITPEREEAMLFTKPYLENAQVIVVKKGSDITTKADLNGKTVGIQKSSSAEDALNADAIKDSLKEVVTYEENVSALQDLGIGRTDAVVVDKVVADWYIKDENADYTVLDETLAPETYGIAVKKGNTELRDKIQKAFDEIVADGEAAKISEKWFGSDIIYTGN
ncbi:MAG: amino acid ABC transporter substrate-binding protein [Eubacteriaceae bacterium]|jgi:polar amino acid transport system substrate-binding protein